MPTENKNTFLSPQVFCHQAMQETTAISNIRGVSMGRGRKVPDIKSDILPNNGNPMILTVFSIT